MDGTRMQKQLACLDKRAVGYALLAVDWEESAQSQSLAPGLLSGLYALSATLDAQNIPLVSLLFAIPTYLWALILLVGRALVTLDKSIAAPCILFAVLALTAFVGPAELVRYYLYLVFGLPLIGAMLLTSERKVRLARPACDCEETE